MKTKLLTTAVVLSIIPVVYSQNTTTTPEINKVVVSDGIFLQIERAPQYSLTATTQDIDSTCVSKSITEGTLVLKLTGSSNCKGKVSVNLACPSIRALEITGKADVSSRNLLVCDSLTLRLQSGGKAYLDLDVKNLDVRLIEGSLLSAKGYAVNQEVYVTTSATYSCFELEGDNVDVETSVGGKAKVCAVNTLNALSKVGGYIGYKCNPTKKSIEKKGNGTIEEVSE